jgi:hypothetical protein
MHIRHLQERILLGRIVAILPKLTTRNGQWVSYGFTFFFLEKKICPQNLCNRSLTSTTDPSYLWQDYYDQQGDDVEWSFVDNYGNNNNQTQPGNGDGSK